MGWTGTYIPNGQTVREFYAEEIRGLKWLDVATVNRGRETYAAVQNSNGATFGFVIIATIDRNRYITYKEMDEEMLPLYYNCPARILDLLDNLAPVKPTPNTYDAELTAKLGPAVGAYEWRQKCREQIQRNREVTAERGHLAKGDVLVFERPFGGGAGARFEVIERRNRSVLAWGENGRRYKLGPSILARPHSCPRSADRSKATA